VRTWQDDQLEILFSEQDAQRVFGKLVDIARQLGFDRCAYGLRLPLPLSRQRVVVFKSYAASAPKRYAQPRCLAGDQSPLAVIWDDEYCVDEHELRRMVCEPGMRYGWAQPCRDACGALSMFAVDRSDDTPSESETDEINHRLARLTQMAHMTMTRLLVKTLVPEASVRLSSQETTVIRWTAEGKTTAEIAAIMGLSVRTVTFHIGNVVKKLNATNKTAAAVRAAVLGLLWQGSLNPQSSGKQSVMRTRGVHELGFALA
jgi:LuxR family quorum-sensing system transcriptional regulator SolR